VHDQGYLDGGDDLGRRRADRQLAERPGPAMSHHQQAGTAGPAHQNGTRVTGHQLVFDGEARMFGAGAADGHGHQPARLLGTLVRPDGVQDDQRGHPTHRLVGGKVHSGQTCRRSVHTDDHRANRFDHRAPPVSSSA
jgi:hypothetical protein